MDKHLKSVLKSLHIVQEASNKGRNPKLGRGFFTAKRLNPYNPLSYIALFVIVLSALICFGIIGMWKEMDNHNPFKWN